jgi:hypothetical protein
MGDPAPPGWYANLDGSATTRYWDGYRWTGDPGSLPSQLRPPAPSNRTAIKAVVAAIVGFILFLLIAGGLTNIHEDKPTENLPTTPTPSYAPTGAEAALIVKVTHGQVTTSLNSLGLKVIAFDPQPQVTATKADPEPDTAHVDTGVTTTGGPADSHIVHRSVQARLEMLSGEWRLTAYSIEGLPNMFQVSSHSMSSTAGLRGTRPGRSIGSTT